jgi:hypothetical protein
VLAVIQLVKKFTIDCGLLGCDAMQVITNVSAESIASI